MTVGLTSGLQCSLPLTQSDMADMLGLSLVHTNRSMAILRAAGMITLKSYHLTIVDFDRLRKTANFNSAYLHLPHANLQFAAATEAPPPDEGLAA